MFENAPEAVPRYRCFEDMLSQIIIAVHCYCIDSLTNDLTSDNTYDARRYRLGALCSIPLYM